MKHALIRVLINIYIYFLRKTLSHTLNKHRQRAPSITWNLQEYLPTYER